MHSGDPSKMEDPQGSAIVLAPLLLPARNYPTHQCEVQAYKTFNNQVNFRFTITRVIDLLVSLAFVVGVPSCLYGSDHLIRCPLSPFH